MTRAILFSDLHAHCWPDFSGTRPYRGGVLNNRVHDAVDVLTHISRYVQENKPEVVIFAGDLFHRKRLIDISVFNVIAHAVWRLAKHVPVYLMAGNHDLARKGLWSSEHALFALGGKKGVTVVDRPMQVGNLGLVPYSEDRASILQGIEDLGGEPDCFVLHAGVNGAVTGAVEHQPREPVTVEDLPYVPIYSGHYHLPQEVTRRRGSSVVYIGAPLEMIRGEGTRMQRGFIDLDLDDPVSYLRVPHRGPRFKRIDDFEIGREYKNIKGNFLDVTYDHAKGDIGAVGQAVFELEPRAWNITPIVHQHKRKSRLKLGTKKGELPSLYKLCDSYVEEFAPADLNPAVLREIAQDALDEAGSQT